jgi:hypothetical protein
MPFYRTLSGVARANGVKVVALSTDPAGVCEQYLSSNDVHADAVVHVSPSALRVRGTPTLVLVGSDASIRRVWTGRLPAEVEKDLLAEVTAVID